MSRVINWKACLVFMLIVGANISIMSQQFDCGNTILGSTNKSNDCEVELNQMDIRTVRVTFHVFQKNDGSENIPNSIRGQNYLNSLLNHTSSNMGNLAPMNLSTSSPYIQDAKIRYELENIYFWQNTSMWSKGANTLSNGTALYNFVMSQSIQHKTTSIHVLFPGNFGSLGSGGRACSIGCNKWNFIEDVYHDYNDQSNACDPTLGNYCNPGNTLRHEFGHNFDLFHSWNSDSCDDTPNNSNCWNGSSCSNNMMDYNFAKNALTSCQATIMHVWLHENDAILSSPISYGTLNISLSGSGNSGNVSCCTINTGSTNSVVQLSSPNVSSFTVVKEWGSGNLSVSNNGQTLYLSGLGSINLKVEWEENCLLYNRSLVFYNAGYYYRISPNPTSGRLKIDVKNEEKIFYITSNGKVLEKEVKVSKIVLYDQNSNLVLNKNYNETMDQIDLDISYFRNGLYQMIIYNEDQAYVFELLKG